MNHVKFSIALLVTTLLFICSLSYMNIKDAQTAKEFNEVAERLNKNIHKYQYITSKLEEEFPLLITNVKKTEINTFKPIHCENSLLSIGQHCEQPSILTVSTNTPQFSEPPKSQSYNDFTSLQSIIKNEQLKAETLNSALSSKAFLNKADVAIVVLVVILIFCLWMIGTRKFKPAAEKWSYGTVGTIIGYFIG